MKLIGIAAALIWIGLIATGWKLVYGYSTTPGAAAAAPAQWPTDSTIARGARTTIVMFVHPECPCTRASLAELAEIADRAGDRASIEVVLAGPGEAWTKAARVHGAIRMLDPLGTEAARFGAKTSGHVVVYDATGALRYAGGITGSRGHVGDNMGRRTVERIVDGGSDRDLAHPVFGCAL